MWPSRRLGSWDAIALLPNVNATLRFNQPCLILTASSPIKTAQDFVMTTANLNSQLDRPIDRFFQASAQTRLVVLHYLAQKIHRASNSATPSAFFSQRVQTVIKQLQQLPREDRYSALEEILHGVPTRLSDAYGELDTNMRMAFWYRLANSRRDDSLLAYGTLTGWNQEQHVLLADLETRDSNELISFLRDAVMTEQPAAIA